MQLDESFFAEDQPGRQTSPMGRSRQASSSGSAGGSSGSIGGSSGSVGGSGEGVLVLGEGLGSGDALGDGSVTTSGDEGCWVAGCRTPDCWSRRCEARSFPPAGDSVVGASVAGSDRVGARKGDEETAGVGVGRPSLICGGDAGLSVGESEVPRTAANAMMPTRASPRPAPTAIRRYRRVGGFEVWTAGVAAGTSTSGRSSAGTSTSGRSRSGTSRSGMSTSKVPPDTSGKSGSPRRPDRSSGPAV